SVHREATILVPLSQPPCLRKVSAPVRSHSAGNGRPAPRPACCAVATIDLRSWFKWLFHPQMPHYIGTFLSHHTALLHHYYPITKMIGILPIVAHYDRSGTMFVQDPIYLGPYL